MEDRPAEASPSDRHSEVVLLRRSREDRVVGGVAGGLGRYLGVDPLVLRIAFVLLTVLGGSGVLLYLIGWVAIPAEPATGTPEGTVAAQGSPTGRVVVGVLLVVVGAFLLLQSVAPGLARVVGPLALIVLGFVILLARR